MKAWCCISLVVISCLLWACSCRFIVAGLSPFSPCPPPDSTDIHTGITIYCSHSSTNVDWHTTFHSQEFNHNILLQPFLHGHRHFTVSFRWMPLHVLMVTTLEIIITLVPCMLWRFCHSYVAGGKTSQTALVCLWTETVALSVSHNFVFLFSVIVLGGKRKVSETVLHLLVCKNTFCHYIYMFHCDCISQYWTVHTISLHSYHTEVLCQSWWWCLQTLVPDIFPLTSHNAQRFTLWGHFWRWDHKWCKLVPSFWLVWLLYMPNMLKWP